MLRAMLLASLVLVVHSFKIAEPRVGLATRPMKISDTRGMLATRAMQRTWKVCMAVDDTPSAVYDNPTLETQRKELEAAAAELAGVAEKFSPEVASFANKWASKLIKTGTAASSAEFVLIDECLVDSPRCEELEDAIKKLQGLAGSDWAGTAC